MKPAGSEKAKTMPGKWRLWVFFALLCILKWWLVSDLDIIYRGYDDDGNARMAADWYWATDYHQYALVRLPLYPLYLAVLHALHLPVYAATEAILQLSALALTAALRRGDWPVWAVLLAAAGILFNPLFPAMATYATADILITPLLCLVFAGLLELSRAESIRQACWRGLALALPFALLWKMREEGILFIVTLGFFVVFPWFSGWKKHGRRERTGMLLAGLLPPVIATVVLSVTILAMNARTFGVWRYTILGSKEVASVWSAMLSVPEPNPRHHVAWTKLTLERIFATSSAMKKLDEKFWKRAATNPDAEINGELKTVYVFWLLNDIIHKHYFDQRKRPAEERAPLKDIDYDSPSPAREVLKIFAGISADIRREQSRGKLERQRPLLSPLLADFRFLQWLPKSLADRTFKLTFAPSEYCELLVSPNSQVAVSEVLQTKARAARELFGIRNFDLAVHGFTGHEYWDKSPQGMGRRLTAKAYEWTMFALVAAGILAMFYRLALLFSRRDHLRWADYIWMSSILIYLVRASFFTLLDASSFWAEPRYFAPAMPFLWMAALGAMITAFPLTRMLSRVTNE